jgi:hypothetical protein
MTFRKALDILPDAFEGLDEPEVNPPPGAGDSRRQQ